ncbi:peptidoglycan-binding protein [Herbidospora mongoliensis]|uniref:peptidoglycan-binding protein n=1 Tax=Herbidospora mongoliensis TaxID=688067 RepID=UPI000833B50C|nr:peptidoglycan-binding protein [Herbidospora mongoliensis]
MRKGLLAGGVAVAALAGGGVVAASFDEPVTPAPAPVRTAEITRGDLADAETVAGTLGYENRRELPNAAKGTVTWTPEEGAVVRRGKTLYSVSGKPVTLMYGTTPMYRPLSNGVSGRDVLQLERNLEALGYDPGTVDHDFTWSTQVAVQDWQEDRNLDETGVVGPEQVVIASGAVRVAGVTAEAGMPAGRSVITTTGTKRVVHVDLAASDQQLARLGAAVTLETPDGRTGKGRITSIGTVARPPAQEGGEATVDVEITAAGGLGRFDQAPVDVALTSETREDVLSVPVEALLALREGGYGVQVEKGAAVVVTTGLFAAGRVEIEGPGLAEGMKVQVPAE